MDICRTCKEEVAPADVTRLMYGERTESYCQKCSPIGDEENLNPELLVTLDTRPGHVSFGLSGLTGISFPAKPKPKP